MTTINVKRLNNKAKLPTHGSQFSAGYDLYANVPETVEIKPHETVKIGTGLCIEVPKGYFGGIVARSGLATTFGLAPANKLGIADSDYRGEYIVALHNHSDKTQYVDPNDRIAQLVILPYLPVEFNEVDELNETERGAGAFGSTGK
jgi:dUTP pyrophosphatase